MKKLLYVLGLTVLVACCCNEPRATSESSGLTCSLNVDLKTQLNTYFQNNPLPVNITNGREGWVRGIVLKKNKVYTSIMHLHLMVYMENGETKFWSDVYNDAPRLDLATSIGADIFFCPVHGYSDNRVETKALIVIQENVACISDTTTVLGGN